MKNESAKKLCKTRNLKLHTMVGNLMILTNICNKNLKNDLNILYIHTKTDKTNQDLGKLSKINYDFEALILIINVSFLQRRIKLRTR